MANSLADLLAAREALTRQAAELDKQIADLRGAARQEAISQVQALMSAFELTAVDLGVERKPARAKIPEGTGKTVAAKYRDPSTGDTWSGRGLKPRWLTAAIAAGKAPASFLI